VALGLSSAYLWKPLEECADRVAISSGCLQPSGEIHAGTLRVCVRGGYGVLFSTGPSVISVWTFRLQLEQVFQRAALVLMRPDSNRVANQRDAQYTNCRFQHVYFWASLDCLWPLRPGHYICSPGTGPVSVLNSSAEPGCCKSTIKMI
jgi:hypothetical protein